MIIGKSRLIWFGAFGFQLLYHELANVNSERV